MRLASARRPVPRPAPAPEREPHLARHLHRHRPVVVLVVLNVTGAAARPSRAPPGTPPRPAGTGRPPARGTGPMTGSALAASPALARSVVEGHAVFYDPGQAAGSCGLGPFPAGGWYASLPSRSYASGRACGSYVDVYGPRGTVRAEVVDVCTNCAASTVNLSRAAFARIADPHGRHGRGELPDRPGPAAARAAGAPVRPGGAAGRPGRAGHQPWQPAVVGRGQPSRRPVAATGPER